MKIENGDTIAIVRGWIVTVLGAALIIYSFVSGNTEALFLGFAVLGSEPVIRAKSQTTDQ